MTQVHVGAGGDHEQLGVEVVAQAALGGLGEQLECLLRTAAPALRIRDERQVVIGACDPPVRAQLPQRLVVLAQVIEQDAHGLAHTCDPAAARGGGLRVLVGGRGIGGDQLAGRDQVPCDAVCSLLREGTQLRADLLGQLLTRDPLRDRRALRQTGSVVVAIRTATARAAPLVPARTTPVVTTGTAPVVATGTTAIVPARPTAVITTLAAPVITTGSAVVAPSAFTPVAATAVAVEPLASGAAVVAARTIATVPLTSVAPRPTVVPLERTAVTARPALPITAVSAVVAARAAIVTTVSLAAVAAGTPVVSVPVTACRRAAVSPTASVGARTAVIVPAAALRPAIGAAGSGSAAAGSSRTAVRSAGPHTTPIVTITSTASASVPPVAVPARSIAVVPAVAVVRLVCFSHRHPGSSLFGSAPTNGAQAPSDRAEHRTHSSPPDPLRRGGGVHLPHIWTSPAVTLRVPWVS